MQMTSPTGLTIDSPNNGDECWVCATGHLKDPVPLLGKSRALCPGGRFLHIFINQVIITGLNKIYVFALKMALDADRV